MVEAAVDSTPGLLFGGRYRLLERIGVGAKAAVHRARDEFLARDVAIKLIPTDVLDEHQQRSNDAEVKLLARLNHHSLIALLDAGTDFSDPASPFVYLVMELVRGPDLRHRIAEGTLQLRQTAQIGCDLADGLDYIHSQSVVHRDVKPANVMLFDYGTRNARVRAKLTDFGIAALTGTKGDDASSLTGTVAYMSPEQVKGESVDAASDIYSLGLVLLQCITGKMEFPGPVVESAVVRLFRAPEIPADLDPQWVALLTAMTSRDPAARPTAREVSMALYEQAVAGRSRRKQAGSLVPDNEEDRLAAVRRYNILDTPPDGAFDRITSLASRIFSVPTAIVSVVDHDRIWFKSHYGTDVEQLDRDPGLCASAILQDGPWIVENAPADPRALSNPLVAGEFGLKFYAGVPLRTRDGFNLGTLCILDTESRQFTSDEVGMLEDLAGIVMTDLELRLESRSARA
ncbi:GAF domain-containing serine/threonine-protein kinase [Arthrobacter sp. EH-1B-1]|uniref:non-specific serine/threonine protein kinase n=1 Tax=Arthrobacter vasquezii TaxID=2977629 RepID=A0ABT6CPW4_9MICC|nr:GAF domain-containing serine/threonine-protein kinase [Arthrobacter vasquezii]MDF9276191.1 GAF domain-containing serine/threonine-protein kinase [Arthrobacter vasquezii]